MKLTEHFTLEELERSDTAKREGIANVAGPQEIAHMRELCEKVLEPARQQLGLPITITSGYRCKALNEKVGGAGYSYHLTGRAADITCARNDALLQILKALPHTELIVYRHRTSGRIDRFHVAYCQGREGLAFSKYI